MFEVDVMYYEITVDDDETEIITCNSFDISEGVLILKYRDENGGSLVKGIFKNWKHLVMIKEPDEEQV